MKKVLIACLLSCLSLGANAGIINVDTSKWSAVVGPSNDRNTGTWVGLKSQAPEKRGNTSGALVSDFQLFGDFLFSGFFSPTTVDYDDNDIVGLVFGWQDEQNHYRVGWSQTQRAGTNDDQSYRDITGRTGLYLIREVGGVSNTLFNISDLFWEDNTSYGFNVSRQGSQLNVNFGTETFSLEDLTFTSGRVGVYTESQTARFWQLSASTPPLDVSSVAEPGVVVFISGLFLVVAASRQSRKQRVSAQASVAAA
ncbi:hypothetical protein [Rheinheimera maricola]|uniref:PEP-CTERM sorting domain-containing protein n=1 Tax=Rheinheimera maricola TaxID=2793282 RepID=A0ABS7XCG1_9GAMM|nr:hypothetical protein [Rheinheimera maricola]MBZ9613241.1 hypothetical protein [Rheinheimera maricola]